MAISNTASRNTYTLDSVTTDFDITFDVVFDDNGDATELEVWLIDSEGNRTEIEKGYASDQYTVAYKTVTYLDATSHEGDTLLITRATPRTQLTDFINNGAYNLNQVEAMSDKLTRIVQEQDATIADRILTSEEFAEAAAESADNAYASEQKAHDWADKAPDVEVETGKYSAKHWASKSATSASNASTSETNAGLSETAAAGSAEDSEAWAVGQRGGTDVPPSDPTYHKNSKYYADLIAQIVSGAMRYQGVWNTTGQTDYSSITTPRLKGDMFYCEGASTTIDGVTYTQGDLIIFNQDVDDGETVTTAMLDKIDNTETVTPDNTCSLSNKTIAFGDNTMTDVASTNTEQTLTNKTINGADNTIKLTNHNTMREVPKDITEYYTDGTLWDRIAGTNGYDVMEDIYVGDYFKMSKRPITANNPAGGTYAPGGADWVQGTQWVTVAGIDTLMGNGDQGDGVNYHHLVMVPGKGDDASEPQHFGRSRMNATDTTANGYAGSQMHTTVLGAVVTTDPASAGNTDSVNKQLRYEFGSHLKVTRELLTNAMTATLYNRYGGNSGASSNWAWADCQAVLMSEVECYGSIVWSSSGYDTGNANHEMPAFKQNHRIRNNRTAYYWLKDVVSSAFFASAANSGRSSLDGASFAGFFVRPRFVIA